MSTHIPPPGDCVHALAEMLRLGDELHHAVERARAAFPTAPTEDVIREWNDSHEHYEREQSLAAQWDGSVYNHGWSEEGSKRQEMLAASLRELFAEAGGNRIPVPPVWRQPIRDRWDAIRQQYTPLVAAISEYSADALGAVGLLDLPHDQTMCDLERYVNYCRGLCNYTPLPCATPKRRMLRDVWAGIREEGCREWDRLRKAMPQAMRPIRQLRAMCVARLLALRARTDTEPARESPRETTADPPVAHRASAIDGELDEVLQHFRSPEQQRAVRALWPGAPVERSTLYRKVYGRTPGPRHQFRDLKALVNRVKDKLRGDVLVRFSRRYTIREKNSVWQLEEGRD